MQKRDLIAAFKEMRGQTKPRKFTQSVELIINFKGLDIKKQESQVDVKVNLPHATGKKGTTKSLLFAKNKDFIEEVKPKFDRVIEESEIASLKKKDIGQIISEFDVLLAEGPTMIAVGKYLGQQLAPKGKMPKPVQPNPAVVDQMLKQMGSVTRVSNKKGKFTPLVQTVIGSEAMDDEQLSQNALAIVDAVTGQLPRKQQNIKSVFVKETMGPPVKIGTVAGEGKK